MSLHIYSQIPQTHVFVAQTEPWTLASSAEPADRLKLDQIIFACAEALRLSALLLQPVMPDKMHELLELLGVDASRRTFKHAKLGGDDTYGVPKIDVGKGHQGALFPPLINPN